MQFTLITIFCRVFVKTVANSRTYNDASLNANFLCPSIATLEICNSK
jgi:hypothetical protein